MRGRRAVVEIADVWEAYKAEPERPLRDQLILHYSPIVKYVAARVGAGLPSSVDPSDLVSYGIFGLIDAIEKFEPGRGIKFETYAASRIRGAILDELRNVDWVPRSLRAKARVIETAESELEAKFGRSPTDEELANAVGMTPGQLETTLTKLSSAALVALDETIAGVDRGEPTRLVDTLPDPNSLVPDEVFERQEVRHLLGRAIASLPERHRFVLSLYYVEGLTLAEIGRVLGVTESRVCQIHTRAVMQLRTRMASGLGLDEPVHP